MTEHHATCAFLRVVLPVYYKFSITCSPPPYIPACLLALVWCNPRLKAQYEHDARLQNGAPYTSNLFLDLPRPDVSWQQPCLLHLPAHGLLPSSPALFACPRKPCIHAYLRKTSQQAAALQSARILALESRAAQPHTSLGGSTGYTALCRSTSDVSARMVFLNAGVLRQTLGTSLKTKNSSRC